MTKEDEIKENEKIAKDVPFSSAEKDDKLKKTTAPVESANNVKEPSSAVANFFTTPCSSRTADGKKKQPSVDPLLSDDNCLRAQTTASLDGKKKGPSVDPLLLSDDSSLRVPTSSKAAESRPGAHSVMPFGRSSPTRDDSARTIEIGSIRDITDQQQQHGQNQEEESTKSFHALSAELVVEEEGAEEEADEESVPFENRPSQYGERLSLSAVTKVSSVNDLTRNRNRRRLHMLLLVGGTLILIVVIVAMAVALSSKRNADVEPTTTEEEPTQIQLIQGRGVLRCGYAIVPGFAYPDQDTGQITGFEAHLCYAIAAALGVKAEFIGGDVLTRFTMLLFGELDIMVRGLTHTMERDFLHQLNMRPMADFSIPYFYSGIQVAGDPFYVTQCANQNFRHVEECADLQVCTIGGGSTHEKWLTERLPVRKYVVAGQTVADVIQSFVNGTCNVMIQEGHNLAEVLVREAGYQGEYLIGDHLLSKEPLTLIVANKDAEYLDFVNSVLQVLMVAEAHGITQATADQFPTADQIFKGVSSTSSGGSFIESFVRNNKNAYQKAIAAGGNYGELYHRFLEQYTARHAVNRVVSSLDVLDTGLLYAFPLGEIEKAGTGSLEGPKITQLLEQDFIRCGIQTGRPGLAKRQVGDNGDEVYSGMDVDYCRALSASLFAGDAGNVQFLPITNMEEGSQRLMRNELDVVGGAPWTLEMDLREPTTGVGFSLSRPYFYGYGMDKTNICMMTSEDDREWSLFVYWIVSAIIYAEENGIVAETSNDMPIILYMGDQYHRVLRDAIYAVGSYAEVYARNMEAYTPYRAPNTLNGSPLWGPQHAPVPGFR